MKKMAVEYIETKKLLLTCQKFPASKAGTKSKLLIAFYEKEASREMLRQKFAGVSD
jgi:hypothetical protein